MDFKHRLRIPTRDLARGGEIPNANAAIARAIERAGAGRPVGA